MLALLLSLALPAAADVFRPAYLQLIQADAQRYEVLWRLPALPDQRRATTTILWPTSAVVSGASEAARSADRWEQRFTVTDPGGLIGKAVRIEGMLGGVTDIVVRVERLDGTAQVERLSAFHPTFTVTASPGPGEIAWDYFILGVEHILGGIDHLLFVLALVMLVRNPRRLLLTITAFTVAHSITLALATLGWIHLPGPPVEAIIALSIVFIAGEVLKEQAGRPSLTAAYPWIAAFSFGLLHGLGFAGALEEVGLPENALVIALVLFNVGVEVGQVLFVIATVVVATLAGNHTALSLPRASRAVSYFIGSVAAFWTIERVAAFV